MPLHRRGLIAAVAVPSLAPRHRARAQPAQAPSRRPAQAPGFYRFRVGGLLVTVVSDGQGFRANPARGMVVNAEPAAVEQALNDALIPLAGFSSPYCVTVVETGRETVLFDAGTGGQLNDTAGLLLENMRAAGLDPARIDRIAVSHFHADHITGLTTREDQPVFPRAEVLVPEAEWAWWTDEGNAARTPEMQRGTFGVVRRRFAPYLSRLRRIGDGAEVAPGARAVAAHGHTPGHTAYHVAEGDQQLFVMGDCANRPEVFLRHPDWHFVFDVDGPAASAARRRLFGRAADERARVIGYHFPFPSNGYVARWGGGFRFVPADWSSTV
jgi:glyoxylase-like metal-dependent hydrolase (beta-lactamase superfamily II)